MTDTIESRQSDLLAGVIWWLKGYLAAQPEDSYPDLGGAHLSAIAAARIELDEKAAKDHQLDAVFKAAERLVDIPAGQLWRDSIDTSHWHKLCGEVHAVQNPTTGVPF